MAAEQLIYGYLESHPCVDCGESDIVVLEFDHLPEFGKAFNLATLRSGYSLETIQREITKCEVVCANCHKRRTAQRSGWSKSTYASRQTGKVATL